LQMGAQAVVGVGEEPHGDHVRRAQVHTQSAAFHDADAVGQSQAEDALTSFADQVGHEFDADGARTEMLRGSDDHPAIAASQVVHHLAGLDAADAMRNAVSKTRISYRTGATAVAVAVLPNLNFTMRPMISVQAKNRSRGRLMVNSAPLSVFTAVPMASRHGLACGFRL